MDWGKEGGKFAEPRSVLKKKYTFQNAKGRGGRRRIGV